MFELSIRHMNVTAKDSAPNKILHVQSIILCRLPLGNGLEFDFFIPPCNEIQLTSS